MPEEPYEPYRRHIRRGDQAEWEEGAARSRPMRTQEEIEDYLQKLMDWTVAILGQHTSPGEPHTQEDFDRLDREMDAMPVKARRTLTRLHLQTEVLVWILQDTTDDLPSETRDKVEEAGVDLYQLEDAYRGEEPDA